MVRFLFYVATVAAVACGSSSEPKEDCDAIAKAIQDQIAQDHLTRSNVCAEPMQPGYEKACAALKKCLDAR